MSAKSPVTLAELEKLTNISDEEEAEIQAAVAADPDEAGAEWVYAGPHHELYPDGADSPMRPVPKLIERIRKTDPETAKRLEDIARRAGTPAAAE